MVQKLFLLSALCIAPMCWAGLIGTTVTGDLSFGGGSTNLYDPANGSVPATGYQNSSSNLNSPTVVIVGGNEFGFNDLDNLDVTSFSSTGFTFTDTLLSGPGTTAIALEFTDTAFTGVTLDSTTFTGLTYGIVGDVITVNIPQDEALSVGTTYTASFDVASTTATPEPSSFVLLAIGAAGLAGLRKLRTRA